MIFQSAKELSSFLKKHNIPVESWGKEQAKTVGHLLQELQEGDSALSETDHGLTRQCQFVAVEVTTTLDGKRRQLVEERQVFNEGKPDERTRRRSLTGVNEKLKPGENPLESAKRALKEELGIDDASPTFLKIEPSGRQSPSYPGLQTTYLSHHYSVILPGQQANPNGYKEVQPDKTTYFIWQEME